MRATAIRLSRRTPERAGSPGQGLRLFVGHLGGPGPLEVCQRQPVRQFFGHAHDQIEQMLKIDPLGPTLMNYPQVLAAARVVGERFGEAGIR